MSYTLGSITDFPGCTHFQALERIIWGGSETGIVPIHVLITVAQNGGGLLGAYADEGPEETGGLVGAVFWWLGTTKAGALKVCSHIAGVHPAWQGQGIGAALKWAQRDAILAQGLTEYVTWTYDPLIATNGAFNLRKLGATCRTYKRNVYGEMTDAINRGMPSDRCQVDWWLRSERVRNAECGVQNGGLAPGRAESWRMLPTTQRQDGLLEPVDAAVNFDGEPVAVPIPGDIGALRRADSLLALAWRHHLRAVMETAFAANYAAVDCVRVEGEWCYLLEQES